MEATAGAVDNALLQSAATAYVVSLKYAPGHKSLCIAFGNGLRRVRGTRVKYILSHRYKWMTDGFPSLDVVFLGSSHNTTTMIADVVLFLLWHWTIVAKLFRAAVPSYIYFANPHPLNAMVALLARWWNRSCQVIVHVHEPRAYEGVHNAMKTAYYKVFELMQRLTLSTSNHVVVSSAIAGRVFRECYPRYKGGVHFVPLLFEDFAPDSACERQYVTYLGCVHPRRGIHQFVGFAEYCANQNLPLRFQIVTGDDVAPFLTPVQAAALDLKIVNGPRISNEMIALALRESVACVLLYDFPIMQSGVVPVAFMNGTPVISTGLGGLAECVRHGETGVVVSEQPTTDELLAGVAYISESLPVMEVACRRVFDEVYHERNWEKYYAWLVDGGDHGRSGVPDLQGE